MIDVSMALGEGGGGPRVHVCVNVCVYSTREDRA